MIYAFSSKDPIDNILGYADKHLNHKRGAKSVYLLEPQQQTSGVPEDAQTFDMTVTNVSTGGRVGGLVENIIFISCGLYFC